MFPNGQSPSLNKAPCESMWESMPIFTHQVQAIPPFQFKPMTALFSIFKNLEFLTSQHLWLVAVGGAIFSIPLAIESS